MPESTETKLDEVRALYFNSGWNAGVREVCKVTGHPVYLDSTCACDFFGCRETTENAPHAEGAPGHPDSGSSITLAPGVEWGLTPETAADGESDA